MGFCRGERWSLYMFSAKSEEACCVLWVRIDVHVIIIPEASDQD